MTTKASLAILCSVLLATPAFAKGSAGFKSRFASETTRADGILSVTSSNASDNASNPAYQADDANNTNDANPANNTNGWVTGDNGGTGFGVWTITDGDGGHYIGSTGLGDPTFGLFNTFTTTTTDAVRPFTGTLSAGQTFSIDLGFSPFNNTGNAAVGINLRAGTNDVITLFTNGTGNWMLNDGGSDFDAGAAATANTAYTFSLTYNGGNSYSFTLTGSPGGLNFTSSDPDLGNIDNVRLFNFNQGPGANFGFNNLAIVPEPSSLALLAGPGLLAGWFFVRRRRA